jgi:hypothetical protein
VLGASGVRVGLGWAMDNKQSWLGIGTATLVMVLVGVAWVVKSITNDGILAFTITPGIVSLGIGFWTGLVSKETNEKWKRHVAVIALVGGLASVGTGIWAKHDQKDKEQQREEKAKQLERLLQDHKKLTEAHGTLLEQNNSLSQDNKELSQENRKLLTNLSKKNEEVAQYFSGGSSIAFLELVQLNSQEYALLLRLRGKNPVHNVTFQMRQLPPIGDPASTKQGTLNLPVLTPHMQKTWAYFRLTDGDIAN